jgi:DNA-binding NarL/FixJ family response regulator
LLAVRKVQHGFSYLSPLVAKETVMYLQSQQKHFSEEKRIAQRQTEVLQLLAEGMSMKEVANEMRDRFNLDSPVQSQRH